MATIQAPNFQNLPEYINPSQAPNLIGGASVQSEDPRLKALQTQQKSLADKYRSNIPGVTDKLAGQYESAARSQLKNTIQGIRGNYNQRGMLYSGKRIGSEYGAAANSANDVNNYRSNLTNTLRGNADTMEFAPYDTGLLRAGTAATGIGSAGLSSLGNQFDYQNQQNQSLINSLSTAGGGIGKGLGNIDWSKLLSSKIGYGTGGFNPTASRVLPASQDYTGA